MMFPTEAKYQCSRKQHSLPHILCVASSLGAVVLVAFTLQGCELLGLMSNEARGLYCTEMTDGRVRQRCQQCIEYANMYLMSEGSKKQCRNACEKGHFQNCQGFDKYSPGRSLLELNASVKSVSVTSQLHPDPRKTMAFNSSAGLDISKVSDPLSSNEGAAGSGTTSELEIKVDENTRLDSSSGLPHQGQEVDLQARTQSEEQKQGILGARVDWGTPQVVTSVSSRPQVQKTSAAIGVNGRIGKTKRESAADTNLAAEHSLRELKKDLQNSQGSTTHDAGRRAQRRQRVLALAK